METFVAPLNARDNSVCKLFNTGNTDIVFLVSIGVRECKILEFSSVFKPRTPTWWPKKYATPKLSKIVL